MPTASRVPITPPIRSTTVTAFVLLEHQQAGRDAAQLRFGLLERPRIAGMLDELDDGFLDLGEIDGALAHDGLRDLPLLRVRVDAGFGRFRLIARQHGAHELAIERVLDIEQRGGDLLEHRSDRATLPFVTMAASSCVSRWI